MDEAPRSEMEVIHLIQSHTDRFNLEKNENGNPVALKLKRILQNEFCLKKSFATYADQIGISHEVMTRYFRSCYGLSPHEFRNKMRLLQAVFDLTLKSRPIAETLRAVGFEDQSHFNEQFKKLIRTVPSNLRDGPPIEREL